MKNLNHILFFIIISAILSVFQFSNVKAQKVYALTASKAECVIDIDNNRVLHSINESAKLPMASTTKILTAITVIDNFDISKTVVVPKSAINVEGSSIYLRDGEKLTVKELLFGLMLRSGNDCAECLATTLLSREDFISLMNKTAIKAGATNSNFTNPHGLHDDNHYTTALDLALITSYALKNPIFKEICSTKRVEISNDGYDYNRILVNKNKLLFNLDGCYGVKTGFTKKAGRCLVTAINKNGLNLVSVVLNSPDMWERTKEILNSTLNSYKITKVFDKNEYNNKQFIDSKGNKFFVYLENDFYYPLKDGEISLIHYKVNGQNLDFYLKNPQKSGIFEIYYQNKLIFSQNIFII